MIFGRLGSESGNSDLTRRMGDESQDITVSQFEGRPRSDRSAESGSVQQQTRNLTCIGWVKFTENKRDFLFVEKPEKKREREKKIYSEIRKCGRNQ